MFDCARRGAANRARTGYRFARSQYSLRAQRCPRSRVCSFCRELRMFLALAQALTGVSCGGANGTAMMTQITQVNDGYPGLSTPADFGSLPGTAGMVPGMNVPPPQAHPSRRRPIKRSRPMMSRQRASTSRAKASRHRECYRRKPLALSVQPNCVPAWTELADSAVGRSSERCQRGIFI